MEKNSILIEILEERKSNFKPVTSFTNAISNCKEIMEEYKKRVEKDAE